MATISVSLPSDGDTIDAADYNTPVNTIVNEINGNLNNANIVAGAAIATSKIASDAGLPAGALAVSSVTPEKILTGTGTTWVWQTWVPTLANLSGGTQTYASYIQIGKTVHYRWKYTLAGAGVGTNPTFTLPVAAHADYNTAASPLIGNGTYYDSSGGITYPLTALLISSATVVRLFIPNTSATYGTYTNPTSTVSITWGSGDTLEISGTYEAA